MRRHAFRAGLRAPPIIPRLAGVAQRSADTLDAAVGVPIFQWRSGMASTALGQAWPARVRLRQCVGPDLERVLELAGRAQLPADSLTAAAP